MVVGERKTVVRVGVKGVVECFDQKGVRGWELLRVSQYTKCSQSGRGVCVARVLFLLYILSAYPEIVRASSNQAPAGPQESTKVLEGVTGRDPLTGDARGEAIFGTQNPRDVFCSCSCVSWRACVS